MPRRIRILHVVPTMNSGGIENYIMNMLRVIDRDHIQFDFLEHHSSRSYFDDEIESYGCNIYRLPVLDDKNIMKYIFSLEKLFRNEQFDIIHGHAASLGVFYLRAAQKAGIPVRIAHSHGTSYLHTPKGIAKRVLFQGFQYYANVRFACSTEAGKFLFGNNKFELVKNAIDTNRFVFNKSLRDDTREKNGIKQSTFLMGHIGRFNLQKNHDFLIDIFKEVHRLKSDSKLLLVGDGETKKHVMEKVITEGLSDSVLFENVTDSPQAYYAAMDSLVMPSLFEGLPLVGIEAQCAGLPCFFSSDITHETSVTDLAHFISLDNSAEYWAREILRGATAKDRNGYANQVRYAGYDFHDNTEFMEQKYMKLCEQFAPQSKRRH